MNETPGGLAVHMIGSLPLEDAETAFRTVGGALGSRMLCLPDGETGRRRRWISFINDQLKAHPDLEIDPTVPPFEFTQWDGKVVYTVERLRVREGVDPASLTFATGYADDAIRNYGIFARLGAEGAIPAAVKYQICMAPPLAIAFNFMSPNAYDDFVPAYATHLRDEFRRISETLPHDRIVYQWDVCIEVLMWEGYYGLEGDHRRRILDSLGDIGDMVPGDIDLGYHLCYGSPQDEHLVQPRDLAVCVEIANGIAGAVGRPVQYIHMPVPRDRSDTAFFEPLADLALKGGTALYLGLVHEDDPEGNARKLAEARKFATVSGIAAECGLGRGDPDALADILEQHRLLAEAG